MTRLAFFVLLVPLMACAPDGADSSAGAATSEPAGDPLPSWRVGETKQAILSFIAAVSDPDSADWVAPGSRIVTFDNDGTLWPEHPLVQVLFARARFDRLAPQHPEWRTEQPFRALLENDTATIATFGAEELVRVLTVTHTGMTQEEFAMAAAHAFVVVSMARDWDRIFSFR